MTDIAPTVAAMLRIRRAHPAFGRGAVTFLTTTPSILALRRQHAGDAVLFVANLSNEQQTTDLDLPRGAVRLSLAPERDLFPAAPTGLLELAPYEWGWWKLDAGSVG